MRAYVYCSYKFSPAGFKMGTITYDAAQKDFYVPTNTNLDKIVVKAFEQGFVRKIYGRIPDSQKYILLVKKLQQNDVEDPNEGTIDVYMNFAFEFDSFGDFNNFCGNFNALTNATAAEECAKFIVPDRNVDTFALKIDAKNFNSFIAKMLSSNNGGQEDKNFFVEVVPAELDTAKLRETLGCDFSKVADKKFCRAAQKKNPFPLIPLTVAIVTAILAGIIWYLTR